MTYEEIKAAYDTKYAKGRDKQEDIKRLSEKAREQARRHFLLAAKKQALAEELRRKAGLANKANWIDDLVVPLMKEVEEKTGIPFNTSDLRSFGIRCNCPVFSADGKTRLNFTYDNGAKTLCVDTDESTREFAEGTLGSINGFNEIAEDVTSVETVIENLRRRFPEAFPAD